MQTPSSAPAAERIVTKLDHARILRLARERDAEDLAEAVDAADLVAPQAVPADVVTMNTQLRAAADDGSERRITLCYPQDADAAAGRLSVLSPAGTALLGRRVGTLARWTAPEGRDAALRITAIAFQPEASGDYLA
ncbi:nucleoside diphosphate kinase regulator [Xylophilus sp.]|uniref:nucleoside diphosphate kinase regulator n=1 Tax=Xylophilus sp. TaxID=2653893 RepID=UPI0013BDB600|nr:nucleoside diphosphate kinase regulator [Xylophilus sp.]KAF1047659.1 MAG: Regulator of nucleoside diphosphate kinase [Xylophilus sp.]